MIPVQPALHVFVPTPVHVPEEHTQPEKSADEMELAGHVTEHAVFRPPETAIGVAWNVLPVHAVHTMSDDTVPAVA